MTDYCERFHIVKDMNGDGMFTISDVWLIIKFIWLLPTKAVVGMAQNFPTLATFFEINCSMGESWGGGIFSLAAWFFALLLIVLGENS